MQPLHKDFDILRKLPNTLESYHQLTTFDGENLYGNITLELGLENVNFWLSSSAGDLCRIFEDFVFSSFENDIGKQCLSF